MFAILQEGGKIAPQEMARTFNCGIGMVAIASAANAERVINALEAAGETVFEIGRIEHGPRGCTVAGKPQQLEFPKKWSATHNA